MTKGLNGFLQNASPPAGPRGLRGRLSLLMFLQYAPAGAVVPLFTLRLQELGFTPLEMGWACATQALAGLAAPLLVGQVADRWCPAERCLAACAALAGACLWCLAGLDRPGPVFCLALAFWLAMVPAITLGTALTFAHLKRPERDFGPVRFWGTVGWVVPGWMLGYWFANPEWARGILSWTRPAEPGSRLADAFRLGGLFAFTLGAYGLTLPHTPPQRRPGTPPAPLAALSLLRRRSFAVYCAASLLVCVTIPFTTQVTPLLLSHLGVPRPWIGPTLTISQSMEMTSLALLPILFLRLGLRGTMLLGLFAWVTALFILTVGEPLWLVVSSQTLNGLCVCCFIVAGQVFINSRARGDIRVSAQALLAVVNALGMLGGNLLVGWVRRQVDERFMPTYAVAAGLAALLALGFFVGFDEREPTVSVEGGQADAPAQQSLAAVRAYALRSPR